MRINTCLKDTGYTLSPTSPSALCISALQMILPDACGSIAMGFMQAFRGNMASNVLFIAKNILRSLLPLNGRRSLRNGNETGKNNLSRKRILSGKTCIKTCRPDFANQEVSFRSDFLFVALGRRKKIESGTPFVFSIKSKRDSGSATFCRKTPERLVRNDTFKISGKGGKG